MIKVTTRGSFRKTDIFLKRMQSGAHLKGLGEKYGPIGVAALAQATPKESSLTANSWYYEIIQRRGYFAIAWLNRNVEDGIPIAVLLQYGHGTRNGGWVEGRDYINPAIQPVFDKIADDMWKEVTR